MLALSFLFLVNRTFCQEGNYRLENYGNNSALLTGNVTASVSDLALTYYNPSRLAFLGESKFLISIKAYQYEQFSYRNNTGPIEKVSDSDFNGIPSMLAGKFQLSFLPNHIFAYSLISRQRTNRNLTYESGLLKDEDVVTVFPAMSGRPRLRALLPVPLWMTLCSMLLTIKAFSRLVAQGAWSGAAGSSTTGSIWTSAST